MTDESSLEPTQGPSISATIAKSKWWRIVRSLALTATLVYPACRLTSRYFWASDLVTHFQEPAFALTLLTLGLFLLGGRRRLAIGLTVLAALQAYSIFRYDGPNPVAADPSSPERLRILFANVFMENDSHEGLIRLIRVERPDVIGLVEYTSKWQRALDVLKADYPYSAQAPSDQTAGGVSLWFRQRPTSLERPEGVLPNSWPVAHASFGFGGKTRHLWVVHPLSPLHSQDDRDGSLELKAIGEAVSRVKGSRIVVGDMNSTDGSSRFGDFLNQTGLRDSRYGFGRQRSWPVKSPYRIAIDHLMLSNDLAVVDRRLGPSIESDHFPLIVDLAPALKKSESDDSQASNKGAKSP